LLNTWKFDDIHFRQRNVGTHLRRGGHIVGNVGYSVVTVPKITEIR